jgi:choice-of-anchor A domain-containing protein/LPXTG-motif cell wall-anchored protein
VHRIRPLLLALVAVLLLALGLSVAAFGPSTPAGAAPVNPAGSSGGFLVVSGGDVTLKGGESEGAVAAAGSLSFGQYQVGFNSSSGFKVDPADAQTTSLLVGGSVNTGASTGRLTVESAKWVAIGDGTGLAAGKKNPNDLSVFATGGNVDTTPQVYGQGSLQTTGTVFRTSSFDFDGAFAQWRSLAAGLSECPATVELRGANDADQPWSGANDAYVYPTGSGQVVLELSEAQLANLSGITFRNGYLPSASRPLVIDVTATDGTLTGWNPPELTGMGRDQAGYVLWSFHGFSQVSMDASRQLQGSVLAPDADFSHAGSGNLVGNVLADSVALTGGGGEVHDEPFDTEVTPCSAPEPDPTTGVSIVKSTNGEDANAAPGPAVPEGDAVTWTYVVTNTGTADLADVTVIDDKVAATAIDCGDGDNIVDLLPAGESETCEASGVAVVGQYENLGSVTGDPVDDQGDPIDELDDPTDTDPSHYVGEEDVPPPPDPTTGVSIVKSTNGQDANSAPGPTIPEGDPVTWTYVVTNTGTADLADVTVTDDKVAAAAIDCGDGDDVIGLLAAGGSATCTATGVAVVGQYENLGSVTGDPVDDQGDPIDELDDPTDTDPSHYVGEEDVPPPPDPTTGVTIVKSTNGQDANSAPGPTIPEGDPVTWTYVVTNTGTADLADVTVTDDKVAAAAIDCGDGDNIVDLLPAGESETCEATGIATVGQYANIGSVTGDPVDDQGDPIDELDDPTDTDPSHYVGDEEEPEPPDPTTGVSIVKSTNGQDANSAPGPTIPEGDPVTWTYVVTNTGTADLADVTVTDDKVAATDIDCGDGDNIVDLLPAGESETCEASGVAVVGQYENLGSVTGDPVDDQGDPIDELDDPTDTDPSHYVGDEEEPEPPAPTTGIDIVKSTNGQDADLAPGPTVPEGGVVTWTYVVTNTGTADLADVTVTDDKVAAAAIDCGGGDNVIDLLPAGESETCTATGVAVVGQYENLGSVTGDPVDDQGDPIDELEDPTDTNPSHYVGQDTDVDPEEEEREPGLEVVKEVCTLEDQADCEDEDLAEWGERTIVVQGTEVWWRITVTNVGEIDLTDVQITDTLVPDCEAEVGDLAVDESATVFCQDEQVDRGYTNVAVATGQVGEDEVIEVSDDAEVDTTAVLQVDRDDPDALGNSNTNRYGSGSLARTGSDALPLLVAGFGSLAAGAGLLLFVRRRRTA